jgi:hypothetical protein
LFAATGLTFLPANVHEVLQSRVSYYTTDVTVIGWNAAFLYDSAAGAETAIQLLEYANSQLLEFRHYDELLSGILDGVYASLEQKRGTFSRWRLARSATSLHTVLLDVAELTERADNAIKFLSDMFAARLYKLAAAKLACPITRTWWSENSRPPTTCTTSWWSSSTRAAPSFLEATVVLILLIELFYFFRGPADVRGRWMPGENASLRQ